MRKSTARAPTTGTTRTPTLTAPLTAPAPTAASRTAVPWVPRTTAPLRLWLIRFRSELTMKTTKTTDPADTLISNHLLEVSIDYSGTSSIPWGVMSKHSSLVKIWVAAVSAMRWCLSILVTYSTFCFYWYSIFWVEFFRASSLVAFSSKDKYNSTLYRASFLVLVLCLSVLVYCESHCFPSYEGCVKYRSIWTSSFGYWPGMKLFPVSPFKSQGRGQTCKHIFISLALFAEETCRYQG